MTDKNKTYRASIDDRFLDKVDRVFDASPRTVFDELIQNARRGGATEVYVTLTDRSRDDVNVVLVRFEDNGVGIESPTPLLCLAKQNWDDTTEEREDPAGMGFFCLSNFSAVSVRSRRWGGVFTPDVFRGREGMETESVPFEPGTTIEWEWEDMLMYSLQAAVADAAVFCGLMGVEIHTGGAPPLVVTPKGYLDDALCRRPIPELGAEIGVIPTRYAAAACPQIRLNFYGVSVFVSCAKDHVTQHYVRLLNLDIIVRVDVLSAGALQLVLPARNAIKHNQGRVELFHEAERSVYEWLACADTEHRLPFEVYARARHEFGVDIGEAKIALRRIAWRHCRGKDTELVLVSDAVAAVMGFEDLIFGAAPTLVPHRKSRGMEGYAWYDALRVIESLTIFVDGKEQSLAEFYAGQDPESGAFVWAQSLKVVFNLSDGTTVDYQPPVLLSGECAVSMFDDVECECVLYVTEAARDEIRLRAEVIDAVVAGAFTPCSDSECETSVDNQEMDFEAAARASFLRFIGDDQGAARALLERAVVEGAIGHATDAEWVWSVHKDTRHAAATRIVGPHHKEEVDVCRVHVHLRKSDDTGFIGEIASRTHVTTERVKAFLKATHGYKEEPWDALTISTTYRAPVDLDKWEEAQSK